MSEQPKRILISGYYGFGNTGDEAILAAICRDLRAVQPGVKLTVLSGDPAATRSMHRVSSILWTDISKVTAAAAATDLVLLGGGGLFHDYWGFDPDATLTADHAGLSYFCGIGLLAQLLEKPLMLYSVGVGPLLSGLGRQYTRAVCEYASAISVRDEHSKRQLREIGIPANRVRVSADPALRLQGSPSRSRPHFSGSPLLAVALRNWDLGVLPDYWEGQVARALDDFLGTNPKAGVLFVPFQDGPEALLDDRAVAQRVMGRMGGSARASIAPDERSPRRQAAMLARSDLVLGMRMHAIAFAVDACVPAVALSYDPKVRSLMEGIGCAEYCLELGDVSAEALSACLVGAQREQEKIATRLGTSGARMRRRGVKDAQVAAQFLQGHAPRRSGKTGVGSIIVNRALLSHARKLFALREKAADLVKIVSERDQEIEGLWEKNARRAREQERTLVEVRKSLEREVGHREQRIQTLQFETEKRAGEYEQDVEEREQRIQTLQSETEKRASEYEQEVEHRDRRIASLDAEIEQQAGEYQGALQDLRSASEQEAKSSNQRILTLRTEVDDREAHLAKLRGEREQREHALHEIHRSRYWAAMGMYWRVRHWFRTSQDRARTLLRAVIPYAGRRRFWRFRRRLAAKRVTTSQLSSRLLDHRELPADFDLVCFPLIDWEFRYQRPQQLLTRFARDGQRCYYLRTTFHHNGDKALLKPIREGVEGVQLPGDADLDCYSDVLRGETLEKCLHALQALCEEADIVEAVCLVQLPFWAPLALQARKRWGWKIVYDCMDDHAGFSNNGKNMLGEEQHLLRESDLVLASSRPLQEKCGAQSERVLMLPNAADYKHFSSPTAPRALPEINGPIIGYFGAISEWFDVEMVRDAAVRRPQWQFVLIGDTYGAEVTPLRALRNVHLLGERPYTELPAYLARFDAACIPFLRTPLTLATNPVKFYEYLSAGKPVVAVELPELEPLSDFYYPVREETQFVPQLEVALAERSTERAASRIELASNNTWDHRQKTLRAAIQNLYGKAAIVLANYNNGDYLRMCLESVFTRTVYPDYRVIMVDNGSEPDVVAYLREAELKWPQLSVIYNDENLGFACACNRGIEAAGPCDYFVLLNSDTVVTRGWLSRLVRHLQEPGVALVGPVTNSIGNEARIEVDYEGMDSMEQFARRHCREHSGECFDIRVLAMYCLGLRRSTHEKLGPLDERYGLGMFEDDDYSLRARRSGGRLVCAEDVFVHHWGGSFYGRLESGAYDRLFDENRRQFEQKWGVKWRPHQYREQ